MHVLVVVVIGTAFTRTQGIGRCPIEIENFVKNALLFEASEDAI